MEIQRLEYEDRITQRDQSLEEFTKKVTALTKRAEKAEANEQKDNGVSMSQEEMDKIKKVEQDLKEQLEQKDKMLEELSQEIEKYSKDCEDKANEIEALQIDIETIQVEKTILEEEKDLIEEEVREQEQERLKAMEESMTDDELKYQNEKLRIALRKLNTDVEVERANWEEQKKEFEEQVARIPELEEKLGDIDVLLEAVEERDEEIENMRETVEEAVEFQQMVEELTEEIVEKEEIIEELEQKVNELEDVQAVQEEINAGQEGYEREMQDELAKKDVKIQELENDVQILEEALLEQDDKESKHKERITDISKENELLKDQLSSAYDEKTKNKISDMIDKQKKLTIQLRESTRKEISGSLAEINVGISNTLADLYQSFIPEKLLRQGYISNFNKIRLVIYVKNKAHLTYNELCKKKFIEGADYAMGEGQTESYEYFRYLCTLGNNSIRCLSLCQKILHALTFMDAEKYKTIADSSFWQNFVTANSFLDNMIKMIKDDTLTTKITQRSFEETLDEFDKFYQENIRGEVNNYVRETTKKSDFDIDAAPKNEVKEQILKIGLAVLALGFYLKQRDFYQSKETDRAFQEKCGQIFWKMMESIQAVDEIEQDDHGDDYFKTNFNAAKRINDKYEFVSTFWEEDSMAFDQTDKDSETTEETKDNDLTEGDESEPSVTQVKAGSQSSKIKYDWYAWVDSVDRDLLSIMSEKPIQELKDKVREENPSPYLKKMSKGPWITLADNVKNALSQSDALKDENEKMKEKIKEQNVSYVKLKKTKEDLEVIKDTLERKIAALEHESQKLSPLMSEKKRLEEKLSYIQSELSTKEKIINTQKDKIDKLSNEKEEALQKRPSESRKSMSKKGSDNKSALLNKLLNRGSKKEKNETVVDDSTLAVLDDLQEENIKLKRSKLFERMARLSGSTPAFAKFMKSVKGDSQTLDKLDSASNLKMTDEESAGVHSSVNEINGIKYNIKMKM